MSENLKRHRPDIKVLGEGKAIAFMLEDPMGVWCHIQEVRDLLDVKDKEIAELKAENERLTIDERNAELRADVADATVEKLKAENAQLKQKLQDQCISCPVKMQEDDVVSDLEKSHKMEVEQLLMKIAGLEKLVETADNFVKQKGGFTVKDITFDGVKLEGVKND